MLFLHWVYAAVIFVSLYIMVAVTILRMRRVPLPLGWRALSRQSVGLAPDPDVTRQAVVQVYAARALGWRGYFGVHPWIAVKPFGADAFTVYEVSGWWLGRSGSSVVVSQRTPDGRWFGNRPILLADRRGTGVDELIDRIAAAVAAYPWRRMYRLWPGPNSNTFVAHVLRAVPELRVDMPSTALGKDYLGLLPFARLPSGTGVQLSLLGLFGIAIGLREGIEINLLGLTFGIDLRRLALKLPLFGRFGAGACE